MNVARALLAAIQGDPAAMRRLHLCLTLGWTAAGIAASVYAFLNPGSQWLLALLVFVSFYANTAGHWSSWQAARVEERQVEQGDD